MCACVCRLNDSAIINTFMSSLKCHPLLSFNLLLLSICNRSLEFTFTSQIIMVRLKCATEGGLFHFHLSVHSFSPQFSLLCFELHPLLAPAPACSCATLPLLLSVSWWEDLGGLSFPREKEKPVQFSSKWDVSRMKSGWAVSCTSPLLKWKEWKKRSSAAPCDWCCCGLVTLEQCWLPL